MHLGLTKSRDDKLLQDLLDKKLRVIVVFEDDYLNHIARIAYKDIQQDNYTYRIGKYNIYKGEEWGFCDFCKRNDCYFIVPNETIESGSSEIPKDLEEAAESFAFKSLDDVVLYGCTLSGRRACFIAGAKWQAEHTPLPNDLEDAANDYLDGIYGKIPHSDSHIDIFIAGAKWQAEQDKETIELAEEHAYLAGAVNEREKMLKEAVEANIINTAYPTTIQLRTFNHRFNNGDKVRVIVCKKED